MSEYNEDHRGDDADAVRRKAKIKPNATNNVFSDEAVWGDDSSYDFSRVDFSEIIKAKEKGVPLLDLLKQGAAIEQLLQAGFTKDQLKSAGIIKSDSVTVFGADDTVGGWDSSDAFSGDPMADPSLRNDMTMEPAFGPSNMPDAGFAPKPGASMVNSNSIKYMSDYKFSPSTPAPGVSNTYSPFAGMQSGPRPTYGGGGNDSAADGDK